MEAQVHKYLAWCGLAMVVIWVGAFVLIAGWIPPSDPRMTPEEVVQMYADDTGWIKLGMVLSMLGSALLVPYGVAISGQLKRIEGAKGLADTQMVSCALLSLEFITPIGIWMSVAYRFDGREADVSRAMHDMGWVLFMTVIWSLWVQLICIGIAVLIDKQDKPVFPRWIGYLNLWVAVMIIPAGTVLFFKHGAFAWNGVVGIYVPLTAFFIWMVCMGATMHRNLNEQQRQGTEPAEVWGQKVR